MPSDDESAWEDPDDPGCNDDQNDLDEKSDSGEESQACQYQEKSAFDLFD